MKHLFKTIILFVFLLSNKSILLSQLTEPAATAIVDIYVDQYENWQDSLMMERMLDMDSGMGFWMVTDHKLVIYKHPDVPTTDMQFQIMLWDFNVRYARAMSIRTGLPVHAFPLITDFVVVDLLPGFLQLDATGLKESLDPYYLLPSSPIRDWSRERMLEHGANLAMLYWPDGDAASQATMKCNNDLGEYSIILIEAPSENALTNVAILKNAQAIMHEFLHNERGDHVIPVNVCGYDGTAESISNDSKSVMAATNGYDLALNYAATNDGSVLSQTTADTVLVSLRDIRERIKWVEANTDLDGDGYTVEQGDCDDANAAINPGATEVPYDGLDNDCDASTPDDDLDGDGLLFAEDCDDMDATVEGPLDWWPDLDGDGNGDSTATPVTDCVGPDGWVNNNNDPDDTVSTNDIELLQAIKIFPNPAINEFNIKLNKSVKFDRIKLIDLLGATLISIHHPKQEKISIDISSYSTGIYILQTQSESRQASIKIVKK